MKSVSRFENNLLRILHCFLGRLPVDQVQKDVSGRFAGGRPPCLSRNAVELVLDALAKGCVSNLARAGGWRRERFLREDRPKLGRLWERTPPANLGLTFTACSLDFLIWITAVNPLAPRTAWKAPQELSAGDMLLLCHAYGALRPTEISPSLRTQQAFSRNGLCRLMYPEDFSDLEAPPADFVPWTTGAGSCILEAYQPDLFRRWLEVEQGKARLTDWQEMRRLGKAQEQVLDGFLTAAVQAGRRDLARFLLRVLAEVLDEFASPRFWIGGLQGSGPRMAEREETYRGALAVVRHMERFRLWQRQARQDGPFDETFSRSQLFLADWERFDGEALHRRAQEIIRRLDPMRQPGTEGRS